MDKEVLKRMEALEERLVSSVLPDLVAQPAFIQVLYFECPPLTQVGMSVCRVQRERERERERERVCVCVCERERGRGETMEGASLVSLYRRFLNLLGSFLNLLEGFLKLL
jgi:hypothetical protein